MVKYRIKLAIKGILFLLLVGICVGAVNEWMKPKYYYNESWPATNTYLDFYQLKKNSVDVLFFGSSHAVSALNPQVIYDQYGITSYNLGCEQQSVLVTYYWLKEALKYQSPQVVVLDTFTFHKLKGTYVYNQLNCSETSVRKAMDDMRLSPLKVEAAYRIEKLDPTQSALSFLLLNIRYHTRWTNLGETDYTQGSMIEHGGVKGFTVLGGINAGAVDETFRSADADTVEAEPMVEVAKEYLDKIVNLCDENGIRLIFVNIPYGEPIERYKSTKAFADHAEIPFYDFNEVGLYHQIGYDAEQDVYGHPNYKGAEKISLYIGKLLTEQYGVAPRYDESYVKSGAYYEHKLKNIELSETTDIYKYMDMINDESYCVFIMAPKNYSTFLDDELLGKLSGLGITAELRGQETDAHYFAVADRDGVTENLSSEDVSLSGAFREGLAAYRYVIDTTAMLPSSQKFSLNIDGTECGNQNPGINIVVYDYEEKRIIDKINVNTTVEERTVTRY